MDTSCLLLIRFGGHIFFLTLQAGARAFYRIFYKLVTIFWLDCVKNS